MQYSQTSAETSACFDGSHASYLTGAGEIRFLSSLISLTMFSNLVSGAEESHDVVSSTVDCASASKNNITDIHITDNMTEHHLDMLRAL